MSDKVARKGAATVAARANADLEPSVGLCVVGIGSSAGGLEACRKLVGGLPARTGMAYILIQHLDPNHESLMVPLLASHCKLAVAQAVDGAPIAPDHLYVISPGTYLAVADGVLRVSAPQEHHGARLPFDFLLHSLAKNFGARAVGVVLSGTGSDGTLGLADIKAQGGLVIAQDPQEAAFDGMPRSAIDAGVVDVVLPVETIPEALRKFNARIPFVPVVPPRDFLPQIIDLLRSKTPHDFTRYKPGTLRRRIERRMALTPKKISGLEDYLSLLQGDGQELDLLANDLLINVTSFFRNPDVFEKLALTVIPDLVQRAGPDAPIRVWAPACSTGEEIYSLAILFREALATAKRNVKLQLFASDVDLDAVASAREGFYPPSIESEVSAERLARFFTQDDHGYRVSAELRACVVFTVQDVLADPPFARLDLVSCRNLLIYLEPDAQAKVIATFHFALREGGVLLLGNAESIGASPGRFEVIAKTLRLYRRIGGRRADDLGFLIPGANDVRAPSRVSAEDFSGGGLGLAELCRRMVMETHAPAAVLINAAGDCLYSLGPTDRYLRMAPGHATRNVLAHARPGVRGKLKSAIEQATRRDGRVVVSRCVTTHSGQSLTFSISAEPVPGQREALTLVCFIDEAVSKPSSAVAKAAVHSPRIADLEYELEAVKAELQSAIRELEIAREEQTTINEEASSVNEEFQSTNEELLTSKEELQSINEELTALNAQLQETLERASTTSDDLQNVLNSTNIAVLFLDVDLKIRFFTPAIRSLFNLIASDIGRPLADLTSLSADETLGTDARNVLSTQTTVDREVETRAGLWFQRRILPYRTHDRNIEGVILTFTDVSEVKKLARAREDALRQADLANAAKSRFIAAASHDLRQPLQTISLLQGLLAKTVEGERAKKLVLRLEEALGAMSGMLNTMLDINQIEAGVVQAEMSSFAIGDLFDVLRDEFDYHAQAQRLGLRVVTSAVRVRTDARLLEQILRNLLSNAFKYTPAGKVLIGCRRRGDNLRVEIWDTGIGIPETELTKVFDEYHQLGNAARERSRGLGLGLAIVQRLGRLLGHDVEVRSVVGKGSVFFITVPIDDSRPAPTAEDVRAAPIEAGKLSHRTGAILVIEDDPELRELLERSLKVAGHRTTTAVDGAAVLRLVADGMARPDLILADFNLPGGMDGLHVATRLRKHFSHPIPVLILTGDISTATLRQIAGEDCVQLNKPVKYQSLVRAINQLLPAPEARIAAPESTIDTENPIIYVVDDDGQIRGLMRDLLEADGRVVRDFESCEDFLAAHRPGLPACLLIDAYLPGMSGLDLLRRLQSAGDTLPSIMITGAGDVAVAVEAMKAGARDFLEKPVAPIDLLAGIDRALEQSRDAGKRSAWRAEAATHVADLTARQREVMDMVLAGHPSKNIAADLGISQRTVENHRATIMKKTGARSLPALARLALAASEADLPLGAPVD